MPLPLLMSALCPMAVHIDAPAPVDLGLWGVGSPAMVAVVGDKSWYGTPAGESLESENFGVSWLPEEADSTQAAAVSAALESAWQVLVEDQGWTPPAGSERYLLWVVLNPYLGANGATSTLPTPDFPLGMTVISLDPTLSSSALQAAAVHQLHHAIQEAIRPSTGDDADRWYREASSVWMQSLALPANDEYLGFTNSFIDHAQLRYDSSAYGHDQGMYLVNRYLEEHQLGPGGMKLVWDLAAMSPDVAWDQLLADAADASISEFWGGFTQSILVESLGDTPSLPPLPLFSSLGSGVVGEPGYLGAEYWLWEGIEATGVTVTPLYFGAEYKLVSQTDVADLLVVQPGDVFGVLSTADAGQGYLLFMTAVPPDTGTGGHHVIPPQTNLRDPSSETDRASRGCSHGSPWSAPWIWMVALLGWRKSQGAASQG